MTWGHYSFKKIDRESIFYTSSMGSLFLTGVRILKKGGYFLFRIMTEGRYSMVTLLRYTGAGTVAK